LTSEASENPERLTIAATAKRGDAPPIEPLALADTPPAPPAAPRAGPMSRLLAAANLYGYPVALAVVVIVFLFWPRNYGPQSKWDAGSDDLILLALVAFLARQVVKRSPLLLDLPGAIRRAVRRSLSRNR
jgi:hypothetical protein